MSIKRMWVMCCDLSTQFNTNVRFWTGVTQESLSPQKQMGKYLSEVRDSVLQQSSETLRSNAKNNWNCWFHTFLLVFLWTCLQTMALLLPLSYLHFTVDGYWWPQPRWYEETLTRDIQETIKLPTFFELRLIFSRRIYHFIAIHAGDHFNDQ